MKFEFSKTLGFVLLLTLLAGASSVVFFPGVTLAGKNNYSQIDKKAAHEEAKAEKSAREKPRAMRRHPGRKETTQEQEPVRRWGTKMARGLET